MFYRRLGKSTQYIYIYIMYICIYTQQRVAVVAVLRDSQPLCEVLPCCIIYLLYSPAHTHTRTNTRAHTQTPTHTHTHAYTHTRTHTHNYTCTQTGTSIKLSDDLNDNVRHIFMCGVMAERSLSFRKRALHTPK